MAKLDIIVAGNPVLRLKAKEVERIDKKTVRLLNDMAETMYEAPGIGLAATQVNVHQRVIVIDVSEDRSGLMALINPVILERDGEQVHEEGCLSVPGIYDGVERSIAVKVKALDERGNSREIDAEGMLAICIQHEMDHLMGKVFVEYLSPLKRNRIKTKLIKQQKEAAKA